MVRHLPEGSTQALLHTERISIPHTKHMQQALTMVTHAEHPLSIRIAVSAACTSISHRVSQSRALSAAPKPCHELCCCLLIEHTILVENCPQPAARTTSERSVTLQQQHGVSAWRAHPRLAGSHCPVDVPAFCDAGMRQEGSADGP